MLVALATLIAVVEGARHHQQGELLIVVATLVIALLATRRLLRTSARTRQLLKLAGGAIGVRTTSASTYRGSRAGTA